MKPGDILCLENTRFHPGEERNDPGFVAQLPGQQLRTGRESEVVGDDGHVVVRVDADDARRLRASRSYLSLSAVPSFFSCRAGTLL